MYMHTLDISIWVGQDQFFWAGQNAQVESNQVTATLYFPKATDHRQIQLYSDSVVHVATKNTKHSQANTTY